MRSKRAKGIRRWARQLGVNYRAAKRFWIRKGIRPDLVEVSELAEAILTNEAAQQLQALRRARRP